MFQTSYEVLCRCIKLYPSNPNLDLFRMKRGNKDDVVLFSFRLQIFTMSIFFRQSHIFSSITKNIF